MKNKKGSTLVGTLIAVTILSTTFVALLDLQASIIRARFFLQNDNTANLLVSEGLEIVRSIYEYGNTINDGKYQVDYDTKDLNSTNISSCNINSVNDSCDLDILSGGNGYKLSTTTNSKVFYRFIETISTGDIIKVTSTVIVKNPRGSDRVYKATAEIYKIN